MIPKILHYCWFWGNQLTPLAEECLASWKFAMPDGSLDMTTNVDRMGVAIVRHGLKVEGGKKFNIWKSGDCGYIRMTTLVRLLRHV